MNWRTLWGTWLALVLLLSGCGVGPAGSGGQGSQTTGAQGPKKITTVILSDPPTLAPGISGPIPGIDEVKQLMNVGLTVLDRDGTRQAVLAETPASVANGLWKVFPDGQMDTTWTLRNGAEWQDGRPFSTDDLAFTARVIQDRELGFPIDPAYALIESIDPVDARTIRVHWRQPYIWADDFFSRADAMPRHLLDEPYRTSKDSFLNLAYWTDEFMGNGPFQLQEWVRGSHITVRANDHYVLGRPKLDEIQVKLVLDTNALVTNILAGAIDLSMSRGISLEQALELREQWRDGRMYVAPSLQILMYPQFMPATPPAMADARFRRALLQDIDRQGLVDNLMSGLSSVAHTTLSNPDQPVYKEIESSIVRYDYDPRAAAANLESMGLTKGPDGFYQDGGQKVPVDIYTSTSQDTKGRAMLAIVDSWQQLGLSAQPIIFPVTQISDREFLMTRAGFYHVRHPHNVMNMAAYWTTPGAGVPENRFTGSNYARYQNKELDALVSQFNVTIPMPQRIEVLKQIVHHLTDQVVILGLFYDVEVTAIGNRMKDVSGRGEGITKNWDAYLWDVQS